VEKTDIIALLGLNAVPGLGPGRLNNLLLQFASARAVAKACPCCLLATAKNIAAWSTAEILDEGQRQLQMLNKMEGSLLLSSGPTAPSEFAHLAQIRGGHPPPVLLLRGNPDCLNSQTLKVAVVGARACTPYGKDQAFRLGAGLAAAGAIVISGAARGIDQAAMQGALSVGGKVVAILGSCLDRPYPPDARKLLDAIVEADGCVTTEFAFFTSPTRGNFPRRNRLIAALSRGTVVVEAGPKSGSMNTVDWCNQLGREVFAVPGPVNAICSRGPHQLLREGAHFTENVQDVLAQFELAIPREYLRPDCPIMELLSGGDHSLDSLAHELGRNADDLVPELMEYEIEGKLIRLSGGYYHRLGPAHIP